MALDLLAVADALAVRYGVMTPPAGETRPSVASSARLDNYALKLPAVRVFPPSDATPTYESRFRRKVKWPFMVRMYVTEHTDDLPSNIALIYRWVGPFLDATHAATKLGMAPTVDKALPTGSLTIGSMDYAGTQYDGIEMQVTVWTTDAIELTP